ncbi:MAG: MarR family transcriptional regulator [Rhodobacteraceae bacterium]|nr:MarR family transcriptional regulator [Paracoccaceae bacterium]
MSQQDGMLFFGVFNEIGIIDQLARALLEAQMPKGLIAPHFTVLNHLVRLEDGRTPVELARAFQVPKTTMTHTLAGLVKHGLVDIRPNPNDGRSKCVWLTDAGREFRENLITGLAIQNTGLVAGFDPDKLRTILPILAEFRAYLDHHRHREPPRDRSI